VLNNFPDAMRVLNNFPHVMRVLNNFPNIDIEKRTISDNVPS
jgi:hypothetical protein